MHADLKEFAESHVHGAAHRLEQDPKLGASVIQRAGVSADIQSVIVDGFGRYMTCEDRNPLSAAGVALQIGMLYAATWVTTPTPSGLYIVTMGGEAEYVEEGEKAQEDPAAPQTIGDLIRWIMNGGRA